MEIRNCKKCGKVFTSYGDKICYECKEKEEELFKIVKQYIYDHPNATIDEISADTEVDKETILRFIKDGRLEIVSGSISTLKCERCGAIITTGRFCNNCKNKLMNNFSKISSSSSQTNGGISNNQKMHSEDLRKN